MRSRKQQISSRRFSHDPQNIDAWAMHIPPSARAMRGSIRIPSCCNASKYSLMVVRNLAPSNVNKCCQERSFVGCAEETCDHRSLVRSLATC